LGNLAVGKWRYLTPTEIEQLERLLEKAYNWVLL
jgi:16S rRNA U516 pseudouridylate synthase RsuA-like enzyme